MRSLGKKSIVLEKFTCNSEYLSMMLDDQRVIYNREGIRFNTGQKQHKQHTYISLLLGVILSCLIHMLDCR